MSDSATLRDRMHWYWQLRGGHVHARVFMNGGKCGDLVFRETEFRLLLAGEADVTVGGVVSVGQTDVVFIREERDPE